MSDDARTRLVTYLRDHDAGAVGGLALVGRIRRSNEGTALGRLMSELEVEIGDDHRSLLDIMSRFGVSPARWKRLVARTGELLARLKPNGAVVRYSPSSRVIELESLIAGVDTKRSLWSSLRAIAHARPQLDAAQLDGLVDRALDQRDRLIEAHREAARAAFGGAGARDRLEAAP